jgi:hypothetical protein
LSMSAGGSVFNEIVIYSYGTQPVNFYVDAVTLSSSATSGVLVNPGFEAGASTPVFFTGTGSSASAATGWSIFNNSAGTTMTELCTAASCPSGSSPVPPADGTRTMHITTTGNLYGILQTFPNTAVSTASVSLTVASGSVLVGLLGPGGLVTRVVNTSGVLSIPVSGAILNEIVIYSYGTQPANFYVDAVVLLP